MARRTLILFCLIAVIAWTEPGSQAQQSNLPILPTTPPPPPPPPQARKAAPIRLGQRAENQCFGASAFWICGSQPSERQLLEYEQAVQLNPADVCARGAIIRYYPFRWSSHDPESRVGHLAWMIQNYPEWDGFAANPQYRLTSPRSDLEYERLRQAWLERTGSAQVSGIVLHNASLYFASYEPALAVALLKRAIELDPHELVYVERLGMLCSMYLMPGSLMPSVTEAAAFKAIAREAENELAKCDDWVLLGGALTALHAGGGEPREPDLYEKLASVRLGESVWSVVDQLPSKSAPWIRSTCGPVLGR